MPSVIDERGFGPTSLAVKQAISGGEFIMAEIKLAVQKRDEFGKGAARRTRRSGKVPAVLYGHHTAPLHLVLPAHETQLALRQANVLLTLQLPDGAEHLALPKQVQRDPIRDSIEHVDLIIVRRGEKVTVEVPLVVVGEAGPETIVNQERTVVAVLAEATNIPAELALSVEGLAVGTQLTLADLPLPGGVTLAEDGDSLVVSITKARTSEEIEAELAAGDAERETAAAEAAEDAAA